jgi:hypothetical protein
MRLTKNIRLEEVVPKAIFDKHGSKAVRFVNAQLLEAAQWLIERHGFESTTINDWLMGGTSQQRGLRIPGQQLYRGDGCHDTGIALDLVPKSKTRTTMEIIKTVHEDAIANQRLYLAQGIRRMECIWLANTWIHIDAQFTPDQSEVAFIDLTKRYTPREYRAELTKRGL